MKVALMIRPIEMKKKEILNRKALISSVVAIGCLALQQSLAQGLDPWQTSDDVLLPQGVNAFGTGIGVAPSGTIFAVSGMDSNTFTVLPAFIQSSTNAGTNLSSLSGLPEQTSATLHAVATDPTSGAVYLGGCYTNGNTQFWLVLRSPDGGSTWTASDVYQLSPKESAVCIGLTSDEEGDIYAVGNGTDAHGTSHWVVRKYYPAAGTWITVDNQAAPAGGVAGACGVACRSGVGVFVVGNLTTNLQLGVHGQKTSSVQAWTVRKSSNAGTNWQYSLVYSATTKGAAGHGIVIDSQNTIYTVGTTNYGAELLQSADAGATWTKTLSLGDRSGFWAVTVVPRDAGMPDDVYPTGYYISGAGYWTTWHLVPGESLTVSDQVADSYGAEALAITSDSLGNLYATGTMRDSSGALHWVTRKLPAQ
jgi:hypothetical protein